MKKPITIGVIAVITAILVTSAVDYSVDAEKPNQTIYAEGGTRIIGAMQCPDGSDIPIFKPFSSFNFGELVIGQKGNFGFNSASGGDPHTQHSLSGSLFSGKVSENNYRVVGVASQDGDYRNECGIPDENLKTEIVIWGKCGEDGTGTINYETVRGDSGSFKGTVICI